ncbi:hypothetical protein ILYODFUR_030886 [Ilyodon furcidens]|uniref:Uncharacterized protein n=1 Tax=Ilyodon furcidens TaxID=33524 RepID=A0ABV0SQL5_9TELE
MWSITANAIMLCLIFIKETLENCFGVISIVMNTEIENEKEKIRRIKKRDRGGAKSTVKHLTLNTCGFKCERTCVYKVSPKKYAMASVRSHRPVPLEPRQTWRRSKGPPDHGNPKRTTAGTTATPLEKGSEKPQVGPPSRHSAEAPAMSPQAPLTAVFAGADPAMDQETRDKGTHHSHRPDRAQGPRPWQTSTGSEPAHTKAPSPGHRWLVSETQATKKERK